MPKTVRIITAKSITGLGQGRITDRFIADSGAPRAFTGYPVAVLFRHSPNNGTPSDVRWQGTVRLKKDGVATSINTDSSPGCLREVIEKLPLGELTILIPRKDVQHLGHVCSGLGIGLQTHHFKGELRCP